LSGGRNRARLQRGLIRWGIAQITHFVWDRGQIGFRENPGGMRAVVRAGFSLTGLAWAIDLSLILGLSLAHGGTLLLVQGIWISGITGLILLNIGFLSTLDDRTAQRLGAANVISLGRFSLLPSLGYLILQRCWTAALIGYLLLALSDVADGIVARRRQEETRLGFVLDPLSDVFVQITVFACLFARARIEGWVLGAMLLRYGLLLFGCLALYLIRGRIWIKPTPFGRASGVVLGTGTVLLLLGAALNWREGMDRGIADAIGFIFLGGAVHVLVIGWVNFRRPAKAGYGDPGRWGLRLGPRRLAEAPPVSESRAAGSRRRPR